MNDLITFVGFKSAGKNTAAAPLVAHHGYLALSFADAMKDALAAIFCWERELLEGITPQSRLWREQVDRWWAARLCIPEFSPRWALRHFGSDIMRTHFNPDVWVLNVERRILLHANTPIVLVDGRFPNEIALARRFGGRVVRIQRGDDPPWMQVAECANRGSVADRQEIERLGVHPSEYAWIGCAVDATLRNDDGIEALHSTVLRWAGLVTGADGQ